MTWLSGKKLQNGKYIIERKLGEGGFGVTYLAQKPSKQKVVIKTLNGRIQRHHNFVKLQQDFLNEALRLAKCSHANVVQVDEVIQEGKLWCIVMEYIDGEDLATLLTSQGPLSELEALRYISQVGEALVFVHNRQPPILHRDVKPQNIMVRSKEREAVLIDFGIAREFIPNLTQTHTQFATEGFAPPEQYEERAERGAFTDVYALAATLYALLTGAVPCCAIDRERILLKRKIDPLKPPKQINASISDQVSQGILQGMALEPIARPQSVAEWLQILIAGAIPSCAIDGERILLERKVDPVKRPKQVNASTVEKIGRAIGILLKRAARPQSEHKCLDILIVQEKPYEERKEESYKAEDQDEFELKDVWLNTLTSEEQSHEAAQEKKAYEVYEVYEAEDQDEFELKDAEKAKYAENQYQFGLENARRARYVEAINNFDLALNIAPFFTKVYKFRGIAKSRIGDCSGAIKDLTKAAEAYEFQEQFGNQKMLLAQIQI